MNELWTIECRTGPIPSEDRWTLRLGSRAAVERARAAGVVRFLGEKCLRLVKWRRPSVALHNEVRRLLTERQAWSR